MKKGALIHGEFLSGYKPPAMFVLSTGRSGSMMIARALAKHPALFAIHEPQIHLNVEAYVAWKLGKSVLDRRVLSKVELKRKRKVEQVQENGLIYVESSHYLSLLIPYLASIFDARFVHLVRDGRQFVRSAMDCGFYQRIHSPSAMAKQVVRRKFLIDVGVTDEDLLLVPPLLAHTRFRRCAWLWSEVNTIICEELDKLPSEHHFFLKLEDFGEKSLGELLSFMNISSDANMIRRMLNIGYDRPNSTIQRQFPIPLAWSEKQNLEFTKFAKNTMQRLDYPMNKAKYE